MCAKRNPLRSFANTIATFALKTLHETLVHFNSCIHLCHRSSGADSPTEAGFEASNSTSSYKVLCFPTFVGQTQKSGL